VEARFANLPPCLVGMEACVGAHHLSRKTRARCSQGDADRARSNDRLGSKAEELT
jgi:transposase